MEGNIVQPMCPNRRHVLKTSFLHSKVICIWLACTTMLGTFQNQGRGALYIFAVILVLCSVALAKKNRDIEVERGERRCVTCVLNEPSQGFSIPQFDNRFANFVILRRYDRTTLVKPFQLRLDNQHRSQWRVSLSMLLIVNVH
jgi:hypothetical protein